MEVSLLDLIHKQDLRPLAELVRDLRAGDAAADVMLVGAMARDVMLLHAYGIPLPRATRMLILRWLPPIGLRSTHCVTHCWRRENLFL